MDATIASQWVEEASHNLNQYKLREAEERFGNVIQNVKDPTSQAYQYVVESLIGLADVYSKRARAARGNSMEWNRMYMHAVAFQNCAVQTCTQVLATNHDPKLKSGLRDLQCRAESRLSSMSTLWIKTLEEQVMFRKPKEFFYGKFNEKEEAVFNSSWLKGLKNYMNENEKGVAVPDTQMAVVKEEQVVTPSRDADHAYSVGKLALAASQDAKKLERQMNISRVEQAIKTMAKQFHIEAQQKHISLHSSLTPDQKLSVIFPMSDSEFLGTFRAAMQEIEPENEKPKEELKPISLSDSLEDISMLGDHRHIRNDSSYRRGILRVWKRHNAAPKTDKRFCEPYKLQIYEAKSPVTESFKLPDETPESPQCSDSIVSHAKMYRTFADILYKLGNVLRDNGQTKEAFDIYNYALGVYRENLEIAPDLIPVGEILRQMGMLKCKQGDTTAGIRFLEESIQTFDKGHENQCNMDTARCWCELGKAYIMGSGDEDAVFEYVVKTIQDMFESDIRQDGEPIGIDSDDSDDDDDEDEEEEQGGNSEAYCVDTREASECFSHALSILQSLSEPTYDGSYYDLYVEVLVKLADCSIMTGHYDKAVLCYEKAQGLHRYTSRNGSIAGCAHVLTMLGATNYFLGNTSRAITIFQTSDELQKHIMKKQEEINFEMVFNLTMMAFCNYSMGQFEKCIGHCTKAFDLYNKLYGNLRKLETTKKWLVAQTIFTLGFSYSTLGVYDKALYYLKQSRELTTNLNEEIVVKQLIRILKAIADIFTILDDHQQALSNYDEALTLISRLGNDKSATALQNQLLDRMANVHVTNKEYDTAAQFLEQALAHQNKLEVSIKGDMLGMIQKLGITYTLAGDLNKAIECYRECVTALKESHITSGREMGRILSTLGVLAHVKACLQDDNEETMELMTESKHYHEDAIRAHSSAPTCVMYANFLYQQGQYYDALLVMLKFIHTPSSMRERSEMVYSGVGQAVLPEHIQGDIDEMDEVVLDTRVFGRYLAILCYKHINLMDDAMDCLVDLYKIVTQSFNALDHSILGYSFMEMALCLDAAESFSFACALQFNNTIAMANFSLALGCWAHQSLVLALYNIQQYIANPQRFNKPPSRHRPSIEGPRQSPVRNGTPKRSTKSIEPAPSHDRRRSRDSQSRRVSRGFEDDDTKLSSTAVLRQIMTENERSPANERRHHEQLNNNNNNNNNNDTKMANGRTITRINLSEDEDDQPTQKQRRASREGTYSSRSHRQSNGMATKATPSHTPTVLADGSSIEYPQQTLNVQDTELRQSNPRRKSSSAETWEVSEETVETPPYILEILRQQQAAKQSQPRRQRETVTPGGTRMIYDP